MTRPKPGATPGRGPGHNVPAWHQPRAHPDGHRLVGPALERATALVTIVRDEGADGVARVLDNCDRDALSAIIVVLAAMVPDDVPRDRLLAWVTHPQAVAS